MRMIVTSLKTKGRRVRVFIDGRPALTLSPAVVLSAGLRAGDALDESRLEALRQQEAQQRALQAALRLLSYRPRSQAEVRQRLTRRGLPPDVVEATIAHLLQQELLDDAAFTRFWLEAHGERGSRRLERELAGKGVDRETARQAVYGRDDAAAALAVARRRLGVLGSLDYQAFRRRLGSYLARRGFAYDVIRRVTDDCWRERHPP